MGMEFLMVVYIDCMVICRELCFLFLIIRGSCVDLIRSEVYRWQRRH